MWIYLQPQNRSLNLYLIEWWKKLIMYICMFMYLFALMFSVFVLIFKCHLYDLLHVNTLKFLLGPIKLNWIELNWIESFIPVDIAIKGLFYQTALKNLTLCYASVSRSRICEMVQNPNVTRIGAICFGWHQQSWESYLNICLNLFCGLTFLNLRSPSHLESGSLHRRPRLRCPGGCGHPSDDSRSTSPLARRRCSRSRACCRSVAPGGPRGTPGPRFGGAGWCSASSPVFPTTHLLQGDYKFDNDQWFFFLQHKAIMKHWSYGGKSWVARNPFIWPFYTA